MLELDVSNSSVPPIEKDNEGLWKGAHSYTWVAPFNGSSGEDRVIKVSLRLNHKYDVDDWERASLGAVRGLEGSRIFNLFGNVSSKPASTTFAVNSHSRCWAGDGQPSRTAVE